MDKMENPLYAAAVGYVVHEQTAKDSWNTLAAWAWSQVTAGVSISGIHDKMLDIEQEVKADLKLSSMPGAWRSAKSVILKGLAYNVPLYQGNAVVGKTAYATETRKADLNFSGDPLSSYKEVCKAITKASNMWDKLDPADKRAAIAYLLTTNLGKAK